MLLLLARIVFVVLLVSVTFLTVTPNSQNADPGFNLTRWLAEFFLGDPLSSDKIGHFFAYCALSGMAILAHLKLFGRFFPVTILLIIYGMILEIVQGIGGARSAEGADALANALGALSAYPVGLAFLFIVGRLLGARADTEKPKADPALP